MTTPLLALAELAVGQASKEATANETFRDLELFANLRFKDRSLSTPPGSPTESDCYLVAGTGLAAWATHDGEIAWWRGGTWKFATPYEGLSAWVNDENLRTTYHDGAWDDSAGGALALYQLIDVSVAASGGSADGDVLTWDAATERWIAQAPTPAASTVKTITGTTHTADATDAGCYLRFTNGSSVALELPAGLAVGTEIEWEQAGAGVVTAGAGAGATVHSRGGLLATAGQYAVCMAKVTATDTWTVTGDNA